MGKGKGAKGKSPGRKPSQAGTSGERKSQRSVSPDNYDSDAAWESIQVAKGRSLILAVREKSMTVD